MEPRLCKAQSSYKLESLPFALMHCQGAIFRPEKQESSFVFVLILLNMPFKAHPNKTQMARHYHVIFMIDV